MLRMEIRSEHNEMLTNYRKTALHQAGRLKRMPMRMLGISLAAACLLMYMLLPFAYAQTDESLTLQLGEAKEKQQFVIEGSSPDFDVDLVMPDGKVLKHDEIDPEHQLYLGVENQRIWVLMQAPAGQYTFRIHGEDSNASYRVWTKDAIEMPEVVWQSPKNQSITITPGEDRVQLSWQASGDIPSGSRVHFYLQRKDTAAKRLIDSSSVSYGSAELYIPSYVADGEYALTIEAENGTVEAQVIDPAVTIIVDRGTEPLVPALIDQFIDYGTWTVDVKLPNNGWDELQAELVPPSGGETLVYTVDRDDLIEMETDEGDRFYRWYIDELAEDGTYSGRLYLSYQGMAKGPVVELEPVVYQAVQAEDHQVQWSIEGERTNLRYMDVTVTVGADSELVLRSSSGTVSRHEAKAADGPVTLQIQLTEGEMLYELEIRDVYGNVYTYDKRLLVDHTAPLLEMIQPLPSHASVPEQRVSGFVELGSTLEIDGKPVEVASDGYFLITGIRSAFTLTATDASGNVTSYHWEPKRSGGFTLWPILVILALIAATAVIVWWLRRTSKRGQA